MRSMTTGFLVVLAILMTASAVAAGVPCNGTSTVWAETYAAEVGDSVEVYVIVRDCYGRPLGNRLCHFASDRPGEDVFIGSPVYTDEDGYAQAEVTTIVAGESTIHVICEGVMLGPATAAIVWEGAEPTLRIGGWMNPEAWHNWIGGAGGSTEVQLHMYDPGHLIDFVEFYYSDDEGESWVLFDTDTDGSEPWLETYLYPLVPTGDGWAAEFEHSVLSDEYQHVLFKAVAYYGDNSVEVQADRYYLPHPPSEVTFNIADWDTVFQETLYLYAYENLVDVAEMDYWVEEKADTFFKGIPGISQQPHSPTHCAPTAAAACLKYFEGQGDGAVCGGLGDSALVEGLAREMGTNKGVSGTTLSGWVNGLKSWIAKHGNGYTVRDFEHYNTGFGAADWKRMRDELERCQDVLTAIFWDDGGGHAMTFNSIVNKPGGGGPITVDWMDPWTGNYEYGQLDPNTGHVSNLSGAGGGGGGTIGKTLIVCPKEPGNGGPIKPGKKVIPGPIVNPIPIPMPWPPGGCHWFFIHIIIIDQYGYAHHHIIIIKWGPPAGVDDRHGQMPTIFNLSRNVPNPFTDQTEIAYAVPADATVRLEIYDVQGRKVRTLVSGTTAAGYHTAVWDGRDGLDRAVAPGVYYARMVSGSYTATTKVMCLQ